MLNSVADLHTHSGRGPLWAQISSFSCNFREKLAGIISWRPPFGVGASPMGNPGSALVYCISFVYWWTTFIFSRSNGDIESGGVVAVASVRSGTPFSMGVDSLNASRGPDPNKLRNSSTWIPPLTTTIGALKLCFYLYSQSMTFYMPSFINSIVRLFSCD